MTIEVGGAAEQVVVTAESPLVQTASGEKSFTIATQSVSSLPLANRSYIALLGLMPGVNSTPGALTPATPNRRRRRRQLHARWRDGDGSWREPSGDARQRRGDFGGQGRHLRISGGIRPLERPADQRRDQERHEPVPRRRSTTSSAIRTGNANSKTNILNGDPKPIRTKRDWGLAIGGPVGKPGGNNKLFFYYNQEFNPRTFGNTVTRYRVPTAARAAGRLLASPPTTWAIRIPTSRIPR